MKGRERKNRWLAAVLAGVLLWNGTWLPSQQCRDAVSANETQEWTNEEADSEETWDDAVWEAEGETDEDAFWEYDPGDEEDSSEEEGTDGYTLENSSDELFFLVPETSEDMTEEETEEVYLMEEEVMEAEETEETEELTELAEVEESLAGGTLPPSGTPVSVTAGWQQVDASTQFSSEYRPMKFYPGISSLEYFVNSDKITLGEGIYDGYKYIYPTAEGQEGKAGAIYHKVIYYQQRWYDVKFTLAAYTSSVTAKSGRVVRSYPFVTFSPRNLSWIFDQASGAFVLRCEILDSETGEKTALNTRFQWWDVDGAQRFGMRLEDGAFGGRYYYPDSFVHVLGDQSVAGIGGLEMVIGEKADTPGTENRACVTYELKNCSTYDISFGERDHISDSSDYSYSEAEIEARNKESADGAQSGKYLKEILTQSDSSLAALETPGPVKSVSNTEADWAEENVLEQAEDSYWYRVQQYVPWQDSSAWYSELTLSDTFQKGVVYDNDARVLREEDGADVTDWFELGMDRETNTFTASAKSSALSDKQFYGYTYRLQIRVKLDLDEVSPEISETKAVYSVLNQADLSFLNAAFTQVQRRRSNEVTTTAVKERKEPAVPVKTVSIADGEEAEEVQTDGRKQEIVFHIYQEIPENPAAFTPAAIEISDGLEDCLEYVRGSVWEKKNSEDAYHQASGWQDQTEGQQVRFAKNWSDERASGSLRLDIVCRIREHTELARWQQKGKDSVVWTVIPNCGSVSFFWKNGTPEQTVQETNEVRVRLREHKIRLTKEISASEVVWAHGNPVFTFCVKGTDADGEDHTYYQTLEFTKEMQSDSGSMYLSAEFSVPAGTYTASEETTLRYELLGIYDVENCSVDGENVHFVLNGQADGTATFRNGKITDEDTSHTAYVNNVIIT
ncbi:MAG: isopeptide-forming domain-containing fimbrial protein [Eubacteriales bacterium]|nr:isopeptide-forming domain-containing fimbrial protein [Eubacteriales bacterium]